MSSSVWARYGRKLQSRAEDAERNVSGERGVLMKGAILACAASALELAEELLKEEREWAKRYEP